MMITGKGAKHSTRVSALMRKARRELAAVASFSFLPWSRPTSRPEPSDFQLFQMLPTEIRILIWEHFLGLPDKSNRVTFGVLSTAAKRKCKKYHWRSYSYTLSDSDQSNIKVALQVCRESAAIVSMHGFQEYASLNCLTGPSIFLRPQDYLDFQHDWELRMYLKYLYWCPPCCPKLNFGQAIRRLSLAIDYPSVDLYVGSMRLGSIVWEITERLPNLAEIVLYFDPTEALADSSGDGIADLYALHRFLERAPGLVTKDVDRRNVRASHIITDWKPPNIPEIKVMTTEEFVGNIMEQRNVSDDPVKKWRFKYRWFNYRAI